MRKLIEFNKIIFFQLKKSEISFRGYTRSFVRQSNALIGAHLAHFSPDQLLGGLAAAEVEVHRFFTALALNPALSCDD